MNYYENKKPCPYMGYLFCESHDRCGTCPTYIRWLHLHRLQSEDYMEALQFAG